MFNIICKPFDALLKGIGVALSSLLGESFSPSFPVVIIALLAVGIVWFFLVMPFVNSPRFLKTVEGEMKISLPWYSAAILLGIFVATPAEFHTESFIMSLFLEGDTDLLWSNFMDWHGFIRICFIAMVLGIIFLTVVNFITKGIRGVFAALFGMMLVFLLGYTVQFLRVLLCTEVLSGFLAWALNMLCLIPEAVLMLLLPSSFVVFLMSPSSVHTYVQKQESQSRRSYRKHVAGHRAKREESQAVFSVLSMPEVITGPYGHKYRRINISANSAEYQTDHDGTIVTIHDGDIGTLGRSAGIDEGYFHW